jgi:hypothetical protein
MSAAHACRFLEAWQSRYGLGGNSRKSKQGLRIAANEAGGNEIGVIAGAFLQDALAHPSHREVTYSSPYEMKLADTCILITGAP